jgi:hypothetical protein
LPQYNVEFYVLTHFIADLSTMAGQVWDLNVINYVIGTFNTQSPATPYGNGGGTFGGGTANSIAGLLTYYVPVALDNVGFGILGDLNSLYLVDSTVHYLAVVHKQAAISAMLTSAPGMASYSTQIETLFTVQHTFNLLPQQRNPPFTGPNPPLIAMLTGMQNIDVGDGGSMFANFGFAVRPDVYGQGSGSQGRRGLDDFEVSTDSEDSMDARLNGDGPQLLNWCVKMNPPVSTIKPCSYPGGWEEGSFCAGETASGEKKADRDACLAQRKDDDPPDGKSDHHRDL